MCSKYRIAAKARYRFTDGVVVTCYCREGRLWFELLPVQDYPEEFFSIDFGHF
jgi:hypothetical protein